MTKYKCPNCLDAVSLEARKSFCPRCEYRLGSDFAVDAVDVWIIKRLPKTVMEKFYQKRFLDQGYADCPSYRAEWVQRFKEGYAWRAGDSNSRAILLGVLNELGFTEAREELMALE